MKKLKKHYKLIITILVIIIVFVLCLFIYKNLFQENGSNRLENIENYKLTKKEKDKVEEKLNEIGNVNSIDIYTNYKIIKIYLELKEDVDFEDVQKISNEAIEKVSSDNLEYYDVEIFVQTLNEESEVYPKIGYKYKTNSEFTWNR